MSSDFMKNIKKYVFFLKIIEYFAFNAFGYLGFRISKLHFTL